MSLFCSLPADAVGVLERGAGFQAQLVQRATQGVEVSAGHALFAQLQEGTCVTYRFTPAPPTSMSKHALRDWGRANMRWVRPKVKGKSNTHVVLRDVASPNGCVTFSVSEASNRIVIG